MKKILFLGIILIGLFNVGDTVSFNISNNLKNEYN